MSCPLDQREVRVRVGVALSAFSAVGRALVDVASASGGPLSAYLVHLAASRTGGAAPATG